MAFCIAVIGKDVSFIFHLNTINCMTNSPQNAPLYLTTSDMEQELDLQYHVNAALDVVEEKCLIGKGAPESKELYLGLLYSTENHKMYLGVVMLVNLQLIGG